MIELLIALLIGIFMLGCLSIMVQDNKRTSNSQNALMKLQDYERVAMTMMTDVIQQAGYFPNPNTNTAASMFGLQDVLYGSYYANQIGFATAGQFLYGYHNVPNPINVLANSDSINIRFETQNGDGVLNCFGGTNTTGANKINANFFFTFNGQLWCENETPTAYYLVGDEQNTNDPNPVYVESLQILYGVNSAGTASNVDSYKNAAQMSSTDWLNVISVRITLTLSNPLFSSSIPNQPAYVSISRTVSVMNQTGI